MSKLQNVWVVAESAPGICGLTAGAAALGEDLALVYTGERAAATGAKKAYYLSNAEQASFISCIPAIVRLIQDNKPQLVMVESTRNGRLAAAAIGAAMDASVFTDLSELYLKDGVLFGKRMVHGGAAFQTIESKSAVTVACAGASLFEASETFPATEIIDVDTGEGLVRFVERRPKTAQTVNIAAAKYLVSVGRGFGSAENLHLATELAQAIGGEVSCSRPVAEEEKWLPKEVYVGVSGTMVKPELYLAAGISGQVQHLVGFSGARIIVAVNKDKNAPIFKNCDYGIIGDLKTILPALTQKFME